MTNKLLLLCIAAILGWAGTASADGTYVAPAAVSESGCGTGPFSGAYIGAQIGFGDHDATIKDPSTGNEFDGSDGAFSGGILGGYNYQCGRFLIGYESDINFLNTSADHQVGTINLNSDIDWYGTSRLRLGLVHNDNILFYVTGGLAYANVDHTFHDSNVNGLNINFSQSNSGMQYGWTIGGGVEFIRSGNWTLRGEALYVDLGSESHHYSASSACGTTCDADADWEDDFWVGRVGLTYKFGYREPAVPLK